MTDLEVRPLKRAEAERVTEKLRRAVSDAGDFYRQAVEGRAWEVMGYVSVEAWVRAEFEGESRGRIYRLASMYEVVQALSVEAGEFVPVSQREAVAVQKEARAKVRQTRPDDPTVTPTDLVDAARARAADADLPAMGPGRDFTVSPEARTPADPGAMPVWLEPLGEALTFAAREADVDLREFVVAALLAACEGITVGDIINRRRVGDFNGEADRKIQEATGIPRTTVQRLKKQAAESARCEACGALKGSHQKWCERKKS